MRFKRVIGLHGKKILIHSTVSLQVPKRGSVPVFGQTDKLGTTKEVRHGGEDLFSRTRRSLVVVGLSLPEPIWFPVLTLSTPLSCPDGFYLLNFPLEVWPYNPADVPRGRFSVPHD